MNSKKTVPHISQENVELVLDAKAILGEGALWHPMEKKLYWVDIEGEELHIFDPATGKDKVFHTGSRIGTVVPVKGGGALVALQKGIHKVDTQSGNFSLVVNPLEDPNIRFNDGKCDPAGRFWVGTMALDVRKNAAVLYRMDRDTQIHLMLEQVTISNGLVWSADKKTMYYIDTPTSAVTAFDYHHETGEISNGRELIVIPESEGHPDGMTIDEEGMLWIALYGGGAVTRWDPKSGEIIGKVSLPVPNVTSCAFGGEKLDTLYITTARNGLDEEKLKQYPLSGGLFAVKPGAKGVEAHFCEMQL